MAKRFATTVCEYCGQETWREGGYTRREAREAQADHFRNVCTSKFAVQVRFMCGYVL